MNINLPSNNLSYSSPEALTYLAVGFLCRLCRMICSPVLEHLGIAKEAWLTDSTSRRLATGPRLLGVSATCAWSTIFLCRLDLPVEGGVRPGLLAHSGVATPCKEWTKLKMSNLED